MESFQEVGGGSLELPPRLRVVGSLVKVPHRCPTCQILDSALKREHHTRIYLGLCMRASYSAVVANIASVLMKF